MNAGTDLGGVQAQAGLGIGVVGNLGAAGRFHIGIGLAGGDDLDAARGQQRTQANAEGEGDGLLHLSVVEAAAGLVAAVGCVEHHHKAGRRRGRDLLREGRRGPSERYRQGREGGGCRKTANPTHK